MNITNPSDTTDICTVSTAMHWSTTQRNGIYSPYSMSHTARLMDLWLGSVSTILQVKIQAALVTLIRFRIRVHCRGRLHSPPRPNPSSWANPLLYYPPPPKKYPLQTIFPPSSHLPQLSVPICPPNTNLYSIGVDPVMPGHSKFCVSKPTTNMLYCTYVILGTQCKVLVLAPQQGRMQKWCKSAFL